MIGFVSSVDAAGRLYDSIGPSTNAREDRSRLQAALRSADVQPSHRAGLRWWIVGGTALTAIGSVLVGQVWTMASLAIVAGVPIVVLVRWSGRRHRRLVDTLPGWLEMVDRSLRSGSSFRQALLEAQESIDGPLREELEPLASSLAMGEPLSDALARLVDVIPGPEVRLVAASLALASENESGVGRALAGVNQALTDRAAVRDEVVGLAAQATASMHALLFLPLGFLVFDGLAGGTALAFLFGESLGTVCLLGGCVLNLVGWIWMRVAIRRRLPG